MDAITMLKRDHRTVDEFFSKFEKAGPRAFKTKRRLVDRMIEELSVHAAIEEQIFYPATREFVPEIEDHVLESLEEHHIVKWTLSELEDLDPTDERFDAKVMVLIESVRQHVKEEERDMFPKVRKALGTSALRSLGERMEEAKEIVPRRPHPRMPDEPPGNVVAGSAMALLDIARETVSTVRDQVRARGNGG